MFKLLTRYMLCGATIMLFAGCSSHEHADHDGHDHDGHDHIESEGHRDEAGLIVMDHGQLEQLGVEAVEIQPGSFANIIKVSGQIVQQPGSEGVVAARQSGIVKISNGIAEGVTVSAGRQIAVVNSRAMQGGDQGEAARAAYNAAKRELDRLTPLHKEGIISTKDYNAALQRVEETRAALGSNNGSNGSASAPISGVVTSIEVADGQYVDAGQTIATIGSNNLLTLRADLPETKANLLATITDARFRPTYGTETVEVSAAGGYILSTPTLASATNGYIPIYFTLPKGDGAIIGGSYCEVYLIGTQRENVISVPAEAVSEQQGNYFVYLEVEPGHFKKQPVQIGQTDGNSVEITAGLRGGDKVVTKGMTYVRLAESSGVLPEGHSHNH